MSEEQWNLQRHFADLDAWVESIAAWADGAPAWPPAVRAAALVRRIAPRLASVQIHLGGVLVVGVVGGTGTGKSTLINALVGERICEAGRTHRPTTRQAQIICRRDLDLGFLGLDEDQATVHRRNVRLLDSMILVDCPDPDTQPAETRGELPSGENRNRDFLRAVLPRCDVIVAVGSQQKYKTHIVDQELLRHAPGRRIVFVQSQAELDDDIRDDWRDHLTTLGFDVPEIHRVDAEDALRRAAAGEPAEAAFAQFADLLEDELANRARYRIKRANILHLCRWLVRRAEEDFEPALPALAETERAVKRQCETLLSAVRVGVDRQLTGSRYLWRWRLIEQIRNQWGGGPLAAMFRALSGIGALVRFAPLARARGTAQMVVAGGLAAASAARDRWRRSSEARALARADVELTDADVAQARSIVEGYALDAQLDLLLEASGDMDSPAGRAMRVDDALTQLAARLHSRLDESVQRITTQRVALRAGPLVHWTLEALFVALPGFLLFQLAKNFFYDHPFDGAALLGIDYVVLGLIWVLIWGWLLRGFLLWHVGRGLRREIRSIVDRATGGSVVATLFEDFAAAARKARRHVDQLAALDRRLSQLETDFGQVEELSTGRLDVTKSRRPALDRSAPHAEPSAREASKQ